MDHTETGTEATMAKPLPRLDGMPAEILAQILDYLTMPEKL